MRSIFALQHLTMKREVLMSKVMSGLGKSAVRNVKSTYVNARRGVT